MEDFDKEYAKLREHEEKFKELLTSYGIGDKVSISSADAEYKSIKKQLKKIRALAKKGAKS